MRRILNLWEDFFNTQEDNIKKGSKLIVSALRKGNKILAAGNGGSASQASHFIGEIAGRFEKKIIPFPAICLNSDMALLTALSNDFGYESVFSYQIEGLGKKGDAFVVLTTSGKSKNIIKAAEKAKEKELLLISLTGKGESYLDKISDISIKVPSERTARIQEIHLYVLHRFAEEIDNSLR